MKYPRYFLHVNGFVSGIEYATLPTKDCGYVHFMRRGKIVKENPKERADFWVRRGIWREVKEEELALIL